LAGLLAVSVSEAAGAGVVDAAVFGADTRVAVGAEALSACAPHIALTARSTPNHRIGAIKLFLAVTTGVTIIANPPP
jgi:hypothetical protein